jgi:hypothetical protein
VADRSSPTRFTAPAQRRRHRLALAAVILLGASLPALAQGWSWPWSSPSPPPVPREPVYRGPQPAPSPNPPPAGSPYANQGAGQRSPICLQLEQRLAQEANRGSQSRDQLPRIEGEIRQIARQVQTTENQLERNDCYEYFLFSKTLRRTRLCVDLAGQAETARRRAGELDAQRQQILGSSGRTYQDEIIRELARYNCGASYQQHAGRSPGASIWQDEESAGGAGNTFGSLPFATYRTVCVRLCDGYYFPISFSTLPNHFDRDADACQSKCAAPVELFYHQNPGGAMEQAVSYKTKQAYTQLRTAFRYRQQFVQGCSCKQAEYVPQPGERRAEGPAASPAPAQTAATGTARRPPPRP